MIPALVPAYWLTPSKTLLCPTRPVKLPALLLRSLGGPAPHRLSEDPPVRLQSPSAHRSRRSRLNGLQGQGL